MISYATLTTLLRMVVAYLPTRSAHNVARRFVRRANAARDARQYLAAAMLYEEALDLTPGHVRLHIQAGHMFKELGDFEPAERHYHAAVARLPEDADLALQLGHFNKVAGRPEEAEAAYARALTLRPGWTTAANELARVRSSAIEGVAAEQDWIVPELLPQGESGPSTYRDTIQVRRLGARRMRSRWGMLKVLRGIEAIRGYCIASTPLSALHLVVDGREVRRIALISTPLNGGRPGQAKYVFNLWHDFSAFAFGCHVIELRFIAAGGRTRIHRETLLIAPAEATKDHPDSDTLVNLAPNGSGSIEEQINELPSIIRPITRTLLPATVGSILVQRIDQLGDLVCSVPAIRRLHALFPEAKLVGLVTAANANFARTLGLFDEVVIANFHENPAERRRVMTLSEQERLRTALAFHRFDIAIDLAEGSESRPLLLLSGARFLYGFKDREFPWLSAGFEINMHDEINRLEKMPPSRKIGLLVEGLAAMRSGDAVPLRRTDLGRERLNQLGIKPGARFAVLHTGARLAYSRWPHFGALASLLTEQTDLDVVILGNEIARLSLPSERVHVIDGMLPFDDFDALLSFCTIFIGNDSGPKHLAALRGVPVISLHMARLNWSEWGQEMVGSIISRRVPCAGCAIADAAEDCGKDFACIRHIMPLEVLAEVARLTGSELPAMSNQV